MKCQPGRINKVGIVVAIVAAAGVLAVGGVALADGRDGRAEIKEGKEGCDHKKGGRGEARFAKADKDGDGALTKDEVGEKKWERIKVADANNDGKVTKEEMKKAREDGKLGHKKRGKKGGSEA